MQAQIFNASAGSGKTYRLAYKYVRDVVEEPRRYRNILAVTFTNKATEEMKSRILREIDTLARGAKSPYMSALSQELSLSEETIRTRAVQARGYILHDYSRFTILTIDTFFQRILRAFIQELGLDLRYNIEIESSTILERSADSLIEQITSDEELRRWLLEFIEERVEDGRKWDIHDGVLSLSRELLKESNHETLQEVLPKSEIKDIVSSAVARSVKSQSEYAALGQRAVDIIRGAGCDFSDFSGKTRSFAYAFLRIAGGERAPLTVTFRKMYDDGVKMCDKGSSALSISEEVRMVLREVCDHYDHDVSLWNTADLVRQNYRSFAIMKDLHTRLKQICDEQSMMLLSETKLILSEFIRDNDAPFIYEKTGNRFDRYMIDEFQDTSLKEWRNFLPLLQNAMSQSEQSTVLIVGDIKQSIYRWRGGDWRILHSEAKRELDSERVEVITLKDNYRSLPQIVEFNNQIIEAVVESENSYLNSLLEGGDVTPQLKEELHDMLREAYEGHTQTPQKRAEQSGFVELSTFSETPPVVERIKEAIDRGFSPCDIMILTRSNSEGIKVANMLLEFKEQNTEPQYRFDVMTREALLVGFSPVSRFIIANFKLALNEDDLTQRAIYNNFLGITSFDEPLAESAVEMLRRVRLKSLEEAFEEVVMFHELESRVENIAYIQALHEQLLAFSTSRIADISLFVEWWETQGAGKSLSVEHSERAVEITTVHKAKGLEKKVVIIPYCNWTLDPKSSGGGTTVWAHGSQEVERLGRFPVSYKQAMRESRFSQEYYREVVYSHIDNVNILYVALTRAVESLHIFIPQAPSSSSSKSREAKRSRIGDVLLSVVPSDAKVVEHADGVSYTFGEPSAPVEQGRKEGDAALHIMDRYPTSKCDLRLRLPSTRYREDSTSAPSPRHVGVLMHKIFEEATTVEDIFSRLDTMLLNCHIGKEEHAVLRANIERSLSNPLVKEWFGGGWEEVRNENDIILPRSSHVKRPDRVMIDSTRAVVVEYKFGDNVLPAHTRQVCGYMELMRQMGYEQVEGYVWYIKNDEIIKV